MKEQMWLSNVKYFSQQSRCFIQENYFFIRSKTSENHVLLRHMPPEKNGHSGGHQGLRPLVEALYSP